MSKEPNRLGGKSKLSRTINSIMDENRIATNHRSLGTITKRYTTGTVIIPAQTPNVVMNVSGSSAAPSVARWIG